MVKMIDKNEIELWNSLDKIKNIFKNGQIFIKDSDEIQHYT